MKLYKPLYKGRTIGKKLHTLGQKAVINACLINIEWEEVE